MGQYMMTQFSVSIHVPLAEHDYYFVRCITHSAGFNSRAPRGARLSAGDNATKASAVSIHVPLAEHDLLKLLKLLRVRVSIHVPLAEHDLHIKHHWSDTD